MKVDLKSSSPTSSATCCSTSPAPRRTTSRCAKRRCGAGLHVSEYGILDDETGETLRCATEEEVYERLGLAWIPPELREGRGELEAARTARCPELITRGRHPRRPALPHDAVRRPPDARADGRGRASRAASSTSRSPTTPPPTASATTSRRRRSSAQIEEVHALNARSTASSCWRDRGEHPPRRLARLRRRAARAARLGDRVGAHLVRDGRARDDRAHGRGDRASARRRDRPPDRPQDRDAPALRDRHRAVFEAAARTGTMLEINASPDRRDLNDLHARAAAAAGVRILVDTDAHSVRNFACCAFGIATARRAWLTPEQVANTRPWAEFAPLRKRAAARESPRPPQARLQFGPPVAISASPPAPTGSEPRSRPRAPRAGRIRRCRARVSSDSQGAAGGSPSAPQPARAGDDAAALLDSRATASAAR